MFSEKIKKRIFRNIVDPNRRIAGYLARNEIERIIHAARANDERRLEPFGFKVYSQNDEDGIIEEIFRRIGVEKGTFLEIGVENGLECNTLYLIHKGWSGYWVEGNKAHKTRIFEKFNSIIKNGKLGVLVDFVHPENFLEIYQRMDFQEKEPDFLSIDIDGNDIYLLEALPCRPKVICIEYNAKFRPNIEKKPVYSRNYFWKGTDYSGSSLLSITKQADALGYQLVATNITGANAFYVRKDLVGEKFPKDYSAEALYNPPRYWLCFDHYAHIGHPADFGPYVDLS